MMPPSIALRDELQRHPKVNSRAENLPLPCRRRSV